MREQTIRIGDRYKVKNYKDFHENGEEYPSHVVEEMVRLYSNETLTVSHVIKMGVRVVTEDGEISVTSDDRIYVCECPYFWNINDFVSIEEKKTIDPNLLFKKLSSEK